MTREQALPYVGWIADNAMSFRQPAGLPCDEGMEHATLVGWQCGFEPMFVACKNYLSGIHLDADEAVELAMDGLKEMNWFSGEPREPDYIIEPSVN